MGQVHAKQKEVGKLLRKMIFHRIANQNYRSVWYQKVKKLYQVSFQENELEIEK